MADFRIVPMASLSKGQALKLVSIGWKSPPRFIAKLELRRISKPSDFDFVLLKGEEPIGFIKADMKGRKDRKRVDITQLYTRRSITHYRQTGKTVAEALAEQVVKMALARGCTQVGGFMTNTRSKRMLQRYVERGLLSPARSFNPARKKYRIMPR